MSTTGAASLAEVSAVSRTVPGHYRADIDTAILLLAAVFTDCPTPTIVAPGAGPEN